MYIYLRIHHDICSFQTELSRAQSFFQVSNLSLLRTLRIVCRLLFLLLFTCFRLY